MLTASQIQDYDRDGYLFPIPVLGAEESSAALRSFEELVSFYDHCPSRLAYTHQYFRWAFELASHPRVLDAVEDLLGPNLILWGTLILWKAPRSRAFVPWHQDNAYGGFLNGSPALTAWMALTPATCDNGCMRFIPGSYGPRLPFSTAQEPDDMSIRGIKLLGDVDTTLAVDAQLAPGEASLHRVDLVHGSNPNSSGVPRVGFISRYGTPAMSQPEYPVHLLRGSAGSLVCAAEPGDTGPESYEGYREYLKAERRPGR